MAKSSKPKILNLKQKLDEKLEEYGKAIANDEVKAYIIFLVQKSKKNKEELSAALEAFFQDETDDFVGWLCKSSYSQDKIIRCRFFPNCTEEKCTYYHPTEIVEYK